MQAPGEAAPEEFFATRMGVYYPTGHVVIALPGELAQDFRQALDRAGFAPDSVYEASAQEMARFLHDTEEKAGVLAQVVASELKQTEILLQLADIGCAFVIVRLDDDRHKDALMQVGAGYPLRKAIYYHTLAIEELPISEGAIPGSSPYGINEVPREDD